MVQKLTTEDVEEIFESSNRQIRDESSDFHRYLMTEIDWRDRLISIKGPRGVGKTTLMRQHFKMTFGEDSKQAVYASLDDLWFAHHSLKDFVTYLYEHGFTHVFLDEVHHLGREWSLQIKNIADQFRKMSIVYSGSSLLQLEKAQGDLSRRQATYMLEGMSFREYLKLEGLLDFKAVTVEELLTDHVGIAREIDKKLKVLPHFEAYLKYGYYPFYRESNAKFRERLFETVNKVLESDYPAIDEVSQDTIRKTRKMLRALQRAGLLALVDSKGRKLDNLSKPEKIYVSNTNLMHALVPRVDSGVARETFFFNQTKKDHIVTYTGIGDFVVDGKWTFEVGGRGKGFDQIAEVPDSFVVNDGVSVGRGNKIPLWLFGFLY